MKLRAASDIENQLTTLAARMARGTDICVKGHRADKSEHVHFEGTILSWARELAAIRDAVGTGRAVQDGLDHERLDVERLRTGFEEWWASVAPKIGMDDDFPRLDTGIAWSRIVELARLAPPSKPVIGEVGEK